MKKLVKLLAVCLMLITAALCLSACSTSANVKVADYVKTYNKVSVVSEIENYSEDEYVVIENAGTWYAVVDGKSYSGRYIEKKVDNTVTVTLYNSLGEEVYAVKNEFGKWVVTGAADDVEFKVKPAASSNGCNGNTSTYIIFGVLIAAVIGLFIWSSVSNKKKQKKAQEAVRSLKVGDRVKTIGGICGFVSEIDDIENTFVLEIKANGTSSFVKFDKGAIYQSAPANGNDSTKKDVKPDDKTAKEEKTEKVEKVDKPEEKKTAEKKPAKKTSTKKADK